MTTKSDIKVLVAGKEVEFSFFVMKNGGATIGLKKANLTAKASKTTKKAAKKKATKTTAIPDGVRFDGDTATIRVSGVDVDTISKPKGQKPKKAWKRSINSSLWNTQGGKDDPTIWAMKVGYGDMPE